jgi:hypothetical protein
MDELILSKFNLEQVLNFITLFKGTRTIDPTTLEISGKDRLTWNFGYNAENGWGDVEPNVLSDFAIDETDIKRLLSGAEYTPNIIDFDNMMDGVCQMTFISSVHNRLKAIAQAIKDNAHVKLIVEVSDIDALFNAKNIL